MTIWPGDKVGPYTVSRLVAYQGKPDCKSPRCTRLGGDWTATPPDYGECYGWHCSLCDEPCSSQGHACPRADDVDAAA